MERSLLDGPIRRDPAALQALLAPGFVEFGSSGRIFTRDEIVAELQNESPAAATLSLSDFAITQLAPELVLATYRSHRRQPPNPETVALRSSLWVQRDGDWKLLFHQGTPIP